MSSSSRSAADVWADRKLNRETADLVVTAPESDLLEVVGLRGLHKDTPIKETVQSVRDLGDVMKGKDALSRCAIKEEALPLLKAAGVSAPAEMLNAVLSAGAAQDTTSGCAIDLPDPEPWPEPVDGAETLNLISRLIETYIVLPAGAADVQALWIAHTYAMSAWDHTGYLAIVSPIKRCGKTTNVGILGRLAYRALGTESISPAALYRVIQQSSPTLVIDEVDRVPHESDIWSVLNSGHSRGGGVLRCVGDAAEPRKFGTYGAKVLGYIRDNRNKIPETVEDRSIRIVLQRQAPGERKPKVRSRVLDAETAPLRRQLQRWATDHREQLASVEPAVPDELDDRAADSWEPLLAIADAVGGRWPELARQLAVQYSGERAEEEAETPGVLLLMDLVALLDSGDLVVDPLVAPAAGLEPKTMVRLLCDLPDRPWPTLSKKGGPMTETALAKLLKPFRIKSGDMGPSNYRRHRYTETAIRDAAKRYAPAVRVAQTLAPSHSPSYATVSDSFHNRCEGARVEPSQGGPLADANPHIDDKVSL